MAKRKRGIAQFKNNIPQNDLHIEFDENNQPCGVLLELFRSYYCMKVQHHFDYSLPMSKFSDIHFDELWLETKAYWNIQTDRPKAYMKRWAKKRGTNWKSELVQDYVRAGLNPCEKYKFMNPANWDGFVKQKSTPEFLAKSAKAKAANAANKHGLRLGRSGWYGRKKKAKVIWPQLLLKYPSLQEITNKRSQHYILGMAKQNTENQEWELDDAAVRDLELLKRREKAMIADGSYYQNKEDPITRVFGPEHGGRSRTVSDLIGYTKIHGGLIQNVNSERQVDSCRSDGRVNYPPIKSQTKCELLLKVGDELVKVTDGSAWPSTSTELHFKQIS